MTHDPYPPQSIQAVQLEADGKCSRCLRDILTLEKAFLDEDYAAVCVRCVADAYNGQPNAI